MRALFAAMEPTSREVGGVAFRSAVVAIAAVLASFGITYVLCMRAGVNASPAVLAAALSVGLMRRPDEFDLRELALKFVSLPLIALGAGLVGVLLLRFPIAGAVLFTGGIALSIALRQYGERAAAIGRTIALPMITILVVPAPVDRSASPVILALLVLAAGAAAFLCATAASFVAARLGLVLPVPPSQRAPKVEVAKKAGLSVSTRMALQMLVALALAFAIGFLAFPQHWPWIVLSAFIVCSGAIGRGDAIYKALLRLGGAIGGTLVAALVARVAIPNPVADAAVIFVVLFFGIWLRAINYAYWAAAATLLFALLQGSGGGTPLALFGVRVLCIFIGVACGIVATWFVYPIRSELVVKRRVADALGAMREALSGGTPDLDHHVAQLERVAPPVRLHRTLFARNNREEHPATWIDRAHALLAKFREPDFDRAAAGAEMRSLGASLRKREGE